MCYAIPGKVESIDGKKITVDYFGQKKRAVNELNNIAIGDFVYAQGGYVIQKVLPKEAEEILSSWKDLFFSLQEVDVKLSGSADAEHSLDKELGLILDKANNQLALKDDELLYLLNLTGKEGTRLFLKTANFLRQKYHQNACCVHGIVEISNYCCRDCAYCGISSRNQDLFRYRMSKEEIIQAVAEAVNIYGFKAIVLQSGEDPGYSIDELVEIIKEIKSKFAVLVVISFGEIGSQGLEKLFSAGARGLLMRFETSNPKIYQALHPGQELELRLDQIRKAYQLGYLVITGSLIGLPGQTKSDIINDIRLTRELNAEMFSFGPFLAHPNTPLANSPVINEEEVLRVLALARIIAPSDAKIVVTTAFETLTKDARYKALLAGANSLMLNVTPLKYRPFYSIYPSRAHEDEELGIQVEDAVRLLKSLGRVPIDLGIGINNLTKS